MKLNSLFVDNMILQAHKPVRVFGEGDGEAEIEFCGKKIKTAAENGKWLAEFPAMDYGGPYEMTVSLNGKKTVLKNIMVGEVLLCAGQSNIQFELQEDSFDPKGYQSNPLLRLFTMDRIEEGAPLSSKDGWCICEKENLAYWSSLGYHLGTLIQKNLHTPVGIISCCQGASVIQSWIDKSIVSRPEYYIPAEKKHPDHFHPDYYKWNGEGDLYHAMIEKLFPLSIGNVVWYQGESNTTVEEGEKYLALLAAMIDNWRDIGLDKELPFTLVQICDFDVRNDEGWHIIQKKQLQAEQKLYKVKTVIASDVSESYEIHPRTKNILAYKIYQRLFQ